MSEIRSSLNRQSNFRAISFFYIYIYMYNKFFVVEDSLTVRGIAFVFFIGDYLECALVR